MATSDLMNRSAAEFHEGIAGARRLRRRLYILKQEFNACQREANKQEIYLSRPSHVLVRPTALGWRWESGDWTFIGLAEDDLADLPFYVIHVPAKGKPWQTCHRTFIDALDTVQWQLGRGILAHRR